MKIKIYLFASLLLAVLCFALLVVMITGEGFRPLP